MLCVFAFAAADRIALAAGLVPPLNPAPADIVPEPPPPLLLSITPPAPPKEEAKNIDTASNADDVTVGVASAITCSRIPALYCSSPPRMSIGLRLS